MIAPKPRICIRGRRRSRRDSRRCCGSPRSGVAGFGSCTDHIISAAAAAGQRDQAEAGEFAQAPRQGLADQETRQMADEGNDTFDRWHARPGLRLIQGVDQPVQSFGRGFAV